MAKQNIVTDFGKAIYPSITEVDDKGQFPTGKFKTYLELTPESMATFKATVEKIAKGETFKVKNPKMPFKTVTFKDGSTTEVVVATSKFKPIIVDGLKKPLKDGTSIGGGSIIRIAVEPYNYDKGLSLRLKKVQVKELITYGGADEFDEIEDGFTDDSSDDGDDLDI